MDTRAITTRAVRWGETRSGYAVHTYSRDDDGKPRATCCGAPVLKARKQPEGSEITRVMCMRCAGLLVRKEEVAAMTKAQRAGLPTALRRWLP